MSPTEYGAKKAIVALARRLAVVLHRMWVDGSEFRWTRETRPTTTGATAYRDQQIKSLLEFRREAEGVLRGR